MSATTSIQLPLTLAGINEESLMAMVIIFGSVIILVGIHSVRRILDTRTREQTKREIAAYVAEGTIAPGDAAMILQAGSTETEQKIADAVAWGAIKPEKAEVLLRTLRSDSARSSRTPAGQAC
ncbi:MAG: hypothetical protein IT435_06430 [Phycisphaerales bacterium]|nr:hypothetical protein [Phycisphaerales bacterium]